MPEQPEFHFVTGRTERVSAPLLLLHGSGMDEAALVPLPGSAAPLPVPITSTEHDQRHEPGDADILKNQFANAGADVSAHVLATGHDVNQDDIGIIRDWLIRKGL